MKIAVIHFGRKGAGPTFALEMSRALADLGVRIYYYASKDVENIEYVKHENFECRFFETYNSKLSYLLSILFFRKLKRVITSLKVDSPDVVYSPMNDLWIPFIFPKLKGVMRIKTIHDVGIHEGNNSIFNKLWNKSNFKDAEKFIILSRKYVSELKRRGISLDRIAVIPHAGFDFYSRIGKVHITKKFCKHLLFFGRIDKYKGLDILLKALLIVRDSHPDVKLSIVGSGDISCYKKDIEKVKENVELHVRWIKEEEVSSFVSACDIVVLPYTHATQSGVIPLAYAFAKPVVATRVGCLDEQVVDGSTGYLCNSRNPQELANTINKMLSEPEKTMQMGEFAFDYMQRNLTWDASAHTLISFIKQ